MTLKQLDIHMQKDVAVYMIIRTIFLPQGHIFNNKETKMYFSHQQIKSQ